MHNIAVVLSFFAVHYVWTVAGLVCILGLAWAFPTVSDAILKHLIDEDGDE